MKRLMLLLVSAFLLLSLSQSSLAGPAMNTNIKVSYKAEDGQNTFFLDRLAFNIIEEFSNYNGLRGEIWYGGDEPINDLELIRAYYFQKFGNSTVNIGYLPVPFSSWQSMALQTSPADKNMVDNSLGINYEHQFKDETFQISLAIVNASNEKSENETELESSNDFALRLSYRPISGLTVSVAQAVDNKLDGVAPAYDQVRNTQTVFDILYEFKSFRTYFEYLSITETRNEVAGEAKTGTYLECDYIFSNNFKAYAGVASSDDLFVGWTTAGVIYGIAPATSLQFEYLKAENDLTRYQICLQTWL